jgi:hypothetical protein
MNIDFSFNNSLISGYFDGSDKYIPTMELIYLHEHPLVKDSFLNELERMIYQTSELLQKKNMKGTILDKFVESTIKLGAELPNVNEQTAPIILTHLRDIYQLCKSLLN